MKELATYKEKAESIKVKIAAAQAAKEAYAENGVIEYIPAISTTDEINNQVWNQWRSFLSKTGNETFG